MAATPPVASPQPPLWLPPDGPLDAEGRERYNEYRLEPVIEALHCHLSGWLSISHRRRHTQIPPRIGVFGGLGQGKSTVVINVIDRLQRGRTGRQKWREVLLGPRIVRFDVSFFKANDLEWRFFTAVLWRRVLRNFAVFGLIISVGILVWIPIWSHLHAMPYSVCLANLPACGAWMVALWAGLSIVILPLLTKTIRGVSSLLKIYHGVDPSSGLYLAQRDRFIQSLARLIPALPDIVIVDDLDRAGVDQQCSFLRAMARFSRELGFAVVVCMDESDLLAAPPNPEAPEELLRKTITVELRIPDRTREDVALLVAVCAREFAKSNRPKPLAESLSSVQFVTDLTRALLLDAPDARTSPRKVWRILTSVALQADQLGVHAVDDLGALLRIDGLCRLVPPLRRRLDLLREALEAHRPEPFWRLLAEFGVNDARSRLALEFFQHTRMMQPVIQDGWFRLLGGFAKRKTASEVTETEEMAAAWSAAWSINQRSVDFFRLFVEAIELDAVGYEHDLLLDLIVPGDATLPAGFRFTIPGGYQEEFLDTALPDGFREHGDDYFAQCWLLWVCALATASAERKPALYERARRWIDSAPEQVRPQLLDLFWREGLADADLWDGLTPAIRQNWWDRARQDAEKKDDQERHWVPIRRFFALPLRGEDFADAWSVLGRPGHQARDGRSALAWWRPLVPQADGLRIQATREASFGAQLWPAPQPVSADSAGWREVLERHFTALNVVNAIQRPASGLLTPASLRYAWSRAQAVLELGDCLDLIYRLACDAAAAPGLRWGIEGARPWVAGLHERLQEEIQTLIANPSPAGQSPETPTNVDLNPERRLILVLIALLRNRPPPDAHKLVEGVPADSLEELFTTLNDQGGAPDWLRQIVAGS